MLAGRAPLGAAGCGRLLAAGLRPLLCGQSPCWMTAGRQYPALRVAEPGKEKRPVRKEQRSSLVVRRFIACPQLARTVRRCLKRGAGPGPQPLLLEFAPGPGILTRSLLDAGFRVVALESNSDFFTDLQSLENSLDGQLKVIHGDFFRLDPLAKGALKPPALSSDKLFETMGVAAVPWRAADVPLKVFGIVPQPLERNRLWRLLFAMYECSSIYRYGRVELNLFISEKEYTILTAKPGKSKIYQALTVLAQLGYEIELLHKEPWSSFATNLKNGALAIPKSVVPNDHLCLVRLTPQQNLFTGGLKPSNASTFIFMVKQSFAKPKSRLTDRLNSWSLDNSDTLLKALEIPKNAAMCNLYPEDYKRLFEALQNSDMFAETLFHDEVLASTRTMNL
ncbi:dimethyladenosine transferase 2, mitochondrial isoform X3 [Poecile atricapillus]|uniref:dimethyladenosine transferase 2, mitochondrial isoform X3 n=1 Tax=Poecile atricapillus TaxID=48891 RepID=UPI002739D9BC|nr:dimethyladenosine transferase 2, mitochondrial isoform X3 [Poecile atricapillus]